MQDFAIKCYTQILTPAAGELPQLALTAILILTPTPTMTLALTLALTSEHKPGVPELDLWARPGTDSAYLLLADLGPDSCAQHLIGVSARCRWRGGHLEAQPFIMDTVAVAAYLGEHHLLPLHAAPTPPPPFLTAIKVMTYLA